MSRILRRVVLPVVVIVLLLAYGAHSAGATEIMTPSSNPFTVRADASGRPTPFTIEATGFEPGTHVYVEQCDGTSPDGLQWSPTIDCDLGTSPAAAVAGSDGSVVFDASDPNLSFHPFRGESPEGLFNCLGVDQAPLNNGLLKFSRLRGAGIDEQLRAHQ